MALRQSLFLFLRGDVAVCAEACFVICHVCHICHLWNRDRVDNTVEEYCLLPELNVLDAVILPSVL